MATEDDATFVGGPRSIEGESVAPSEVSAEKGVFSGRPWFDVTNYGAVGDGSTDDSTPIQEAVNDAQSTDGMGVAYFPEPDTSYLLNSGILANEGVALVGPRPYSSRLQAGPDLSTSMLVNDTGGGYPASDIYVWGLEFDGTGGWQNQSYQPSFKCIGFKIPETDDPDTGNVVIEQVYAHDSRGTALGIDSIPNLVIKDCIVEGGGTDGETTGSNGLGIGVGEKTGRCPTWLINNDIRDTAEFGIILEQTGDNVMGEDYHIINNTVDDARIGIGVELVKDVDVSHNNIYVSSRMDRAIIGDSLDSTIGPDRVRAIGNSVADPMGRDAQVDVATYEWGADAAFCTGFGNTIKTGVADFANDRGFRNNGVFCAWRGVGQEAAGFGGKPTTTDRWGAMGVGQVENTDDGATWTLDPAKGWHQTAPADAVNLSGNTASIAGFRAFDDGTNTTGSGALCQWDATNNQWIPFDGSATFS